MTQPLESHKGLGYPEVISQLVGAAPMSAPAAQEPPGTTYGPSPAPETRPVGPGGGVIPVQDAESAAPGSPGPSGVSGGGISTPQAGPGGGSLRGYAPDARFGGLFQSFGEELGGVTRALGEARTGFQEAAGPRRTFAGIGGEETLRKYTQEGDREAREGAEALAFSRYAGPSGLDKATVDSITGQVQALRELGRAGRSQAGTETLLRERSQGALSPGELRFEARRLQADPTHRAQAEAAEREAETTAGAFEAARREAEELAQARTADEAEISRLAQEYLTREASGYEDLWGRMVEEEKARQAQGQKEYGEFQATGDVGELQDLLPYAGEENLAAFDTPTLRSLERGKALQAELMGREEYAPIRDLPPMRLSVSGRGRQRLELDPAWVKANQKNYRPNELKPGGRIYELALRRQEDLVEQGFSPRPELYRKPGVRIEKGEEGEYGQLLPLYFGEDLPEFTPADPRGYVRFDPGISPSRENVSTADQRAIFNRIQEILKSEKTIEGPEPGGEARQAQLVADVGRFLEDEKQAIEERRNDLTESQKEWARMLRSARKGYKKAKRVAKFGRTGQIVGGVVGSGLGPLGGLGGAAAGSVVGGEIGKSLA